MLTATHHTAQQQKSSMAQHNWRQIQEQQNNPTNMAGSQLSQRYEQLLRLEKHTDCCFHICDAHVKCHRLILSAASPVFEAMFYGALREHDREIEIHDISPEIFKLLIECIYVGGARFERLTLQEIIELYYAAEKYLLVELTNHCLVEMTGKLRFSNILPAMELTVYMHLTRLFEVCMTFFMRCCVNNTQYMKYLKEHYLHVSKDCVKAIIAACKEPHKLLFWYVYEWTQQECVELGLQQCDSSLIIDELQLNNVACTDVGTKLAGQQQELIFAERVYYKACRPFTVDANAHVWRTRLKSGRFISLAGLVLNSRLAPIFTNAWPQQQTSIEYNEAMHIDISVLRDTAALEATLSEVNNIWSFSIQKQCTKYNCDLNINWHEGVVLMPDVLYELQLSWDPSAYGAEYPCSLQSCAIDGIKFIDGDSFSGSLLKGVRYTNLV